MSGGSIYRGQPGPGGSLCGEVQCVMGNCHIPPGQNDRQIGD